MVDDDTHLRTLLEIRLSHLGYQPFLAPDGATAIDQAAEIKPDLIISDIMMPGMDGFEFCRRLRSTRGFENIPFIFLTALTGIEARVLGLRLGADDYIVKPFDFRELQARLEVLLARFDRYQQMAPTIQTETTGRLSDLGLTDILQMLAFGRKTCQVELEREDEQATLYFLEGKLTHAVSAKKIGVNALNHLLTWGDGHFIIRPGVRAEENSITQELEELLLEGVRQVDELERVKRKLPDLSFVPELYRDKATHDPDPELLQLIDGVKSIRAIVAQSPSADLVVFSSLAQWFEQGVVGFKGLTPVVKPQPTTINLLVIGFDRELRNRFIQSVLSTGSNSTTDTTQLGDMGEVQLSDTLTVKLLGVSSMKHFAPFWLSFTQRAQGFIVLESGSGDEETALFASRFLKEQSPLPGMMLKLRTTAKEFKTEVVKELTVVECNLEDKNQLEKLLKDFTRTITAGKS